MRRNGHAIICALLCLFACAPAPDQAEPQAPADPQVTAFDAAVDRFLEMLDADDWIVSWEGEEPRGQGDSLLWESMALGVLPCAKATKIEGALLAMLGELGGGLYRHPSLPNAVSLDGALGFWWGVGQRVARCPESKDRWAEAFRLHVAFTAARKLNPHSSTTIPAPFLAVRDSVGWQLGVTSAPSALEVDGLAKVLAGWAELVKRTQAAGYRIHLGLLSLQAVEASGVAIWGSSRDSYCAVTGGVDMPTVDHYCGRGDLAAWTAAYQPDVWEYRHQRAGWESPDGNGFTRPGLDYIVAMRALYAPLPFRFRMWAQAIPHN